MGLKRKSDEEIYSENVKRIKLEPYEGKATIEDIPVEILWKIIDYLDWDGLIDLRRMCSSFSITLNAIFYHCYNIIPKNIISARRELYNRLNSANLNDQAVRLSTVKNILHLTWIETEWNTLESIFLRYNTHSENYLFAQLWPILKEIGESVDILKDEFEPFVGDMIGCNVDNLRLRLPLWSQFIEEFDVRIEHNFGLSLPFETRVIDVLTCCPASNTNIVLKRSTDGVLDIKAFFQIQDSLTESLIADFDINPPNIDDKKDVLKMFRYLVRRSNSAYLTDVHNEMKSFQNDIDIVDKYKQSLSTLYKPLTYKKSISDRSISYTRQNSYNVSINFMECFLERKSLKKSDIPLLYIYPHLFNIDIIQNTHPTCASEYDSEYINNPYSNNDLNKNKIKSSNLQYEI